MRLPADHTEYALHRLRTIAQVSHEINPANLLRLLQDEAHFNRTNDILNWLDSKPQDAERCARRAIEQSQPHMKQN